MRSRFVSFAVAAVAALGFSGALEAQDNSRLRALRITGEIRLDGVPDEPEWARADSITEFRQREPVEGASPSERTVVRVLYGPRGLYIGVWAYDREPDRLVRTLLRRDADPEPDDFVAIVLDPLRDRRTAWVFTVNPNGYQADGLVRSQEDVDTDWNGVWDARSRIGAEGWTSEILIPWQLLRYPSGSGSWGINFYRQIRRRNEEVLWQAWRRQQGLFFLDGTGSLEGLEDLPERRLAEFRPYLLSQAVAPTRGFDSTGAYVVTDAGEASAQVGGEMKLALAPTVTMDLSLNTDFAQVEADRQVVNLTRFPLFFPEKRQFFLENAQIFEFGQRERAQLFYSRRIGLGTDGQPLPIAAGARVTGRLGRERIGLLAVRTGGEEDAVDVVARVQHDIGSRGYAGAMATVQDGPGVATRSSGWGLDFNLPTVRNGQNLTAGGFVAWTRSAPGARPAAAWRLVLDYPNNNVDHFLGISRIDSGFDPALGFVRQTGVWRAQGALRFFPRPGRWGIRRFAFTLLGLDVATRLDGAMDNGSFSVRPLGIQFDSGDQLDFTIRHNIDVPSDSFELFPGRDVAPGRYRWTRAELEFETSSARPLSAQIGVRRGGYYGGASTGASGEVMLRLAPHFIAGADAEWTRVSLAGGRFDAAAARLRLD
ncbi:MAG TPA: DUF5916 domain-containing protein, partial [Gemmatimonadales bacterium]|nr:DUF5916 domain-containing protein [Gemmatimonadales bacterium]